MQMIDNYGKNKTESEHNLCEYLTHDRAEKERRSDEWLIAKMT